MDLNPKLNRFEWFLVVLIFIAAVGIVLLAEPIKTISERGLQDKPEGSSPCQV